ncbi:MAG: hypothetical protein ACTSPB_11940 [Candidatus Thorarchaeota archaeon]
MTRVVCFIDKDGRMGVCTHHYSGEYAEGDCKTCSFPSEIHDHLEQFSYARWTDSTLREVNSDD